MKIPASHCPRFRVGKTQFYISVIQSVDISTGEWKQPLIYIPKIDGINPPAGNAVSNALGKAINTCRELQYFTGRPSK